MLSKKYRLPIQLFVVKRGKLIKTQFFLLKSYPTGGATSRFGVTISAKTAKKATDRNKFKRMVYNFIREYYKKIPVGDYWITILAPAIHLSKEKFKEELRKTLNPKP